MVTSESLCEDARVNLIRSIAHKINAAPGKIYMQVGVLGCSVYAISGCIVNSYNNEHFDFKLEYLDPRKNKKSSWQAALLDIDVREEAFNYLLTAAGMPAISIFYDRDKF